MKVLIYFIVAFAIIFIAAKYKRNHTNSISDDEFIGILAIAVTWPLSLILATAFYVGGTIMVLIDKYLKSFEK